MSEYIFNTREYGAGVWMFGQFVDRYATDGYGQPVSMVEAIALAGMVEEITAVDLNFPFWDEHTDLPVVKDALERSGLRAAAITPAIYTREFRGGAFTNPDPAVRQRAFDLVDRATEVAVELGADYVKLWPGQDGYDYPLQVDHAELWRLALDGVRRVAERRPEVRYAIEYKPKEPRTHIVFSTAARTLLAIEETGLANVGILLDLGHSLYAGETPADAASLIIQRGRLYGIDFNDNFRSWDDDLAVGSVHLFETLELLLALRRQKWEGLWQLDQFPFRENPVAAARHSIRILSALDRLLDRLDLDVLATAQERQDALAAHGLVHDVLFSHLVAED